LEQWATKLTLLNFRPPAGSCRFGSRCLRAIGGHPATPVHLPA